MKEIIKILNSEFNKENSTFFDKNFDFKIYRQDDQNQIDIPKSDLNTLVDNLNFCWRFHFETKDFHTVNDSFLFAGIRRYNKVTGDLKTVNCFRAIALDESGFNILEICELDNDFYSNNFFSFHMWEGMDKTELVYIKDKPHIRFYYKDSTLKKDISIFSFGVKTVEGAEFFIRLFNQIKNYKQSIDQRIEDEVNEIFNEVEKLVEIDKNYQQALNILEIKENEENDLVFNLRHYPYYYYSKMVSLINLDKIDECLITINEALSKFEVGGEIMSRILLTKAEILLDRREYFNSLELLSQMKAVNQEIFSKIELEEVRDIIHKEIEVNFTRISKNERKVVLMTNEIFRSSNESFIALNMNNLPNLNFPIGHPQLNEIYIAHPRRNDFYLPLNNTAEQLTLDRISEYAILLQGLGATSIDISSNKTDVSEGKSKSKRKVGVDVGIKAHGLKVDYSKEKNKDSFSDFDSKISQTYSYDPIKQPYIPEGLVWYHSDLNWQKLARQRLEGNLRTHTEEISLSQVENVSSQELQNINVDLKAFFVKAGVKYSKDIKLESTSNKKQTWTLSVKFENVKNLTEIHEPLVIDHSVSIDQISNSLITKYKEDVLFMLEDDGIIDEVERKMLNRKIEKYGLTKEEADRIEQELMFNADEVKYLDEFKILLEEGEIGEMERSMLERYAKRFNISKDRQKKIEMIVNIN